jgi:lysophospholipase L1-like esterase
VAFYGDSITQLLGMELKDELSPELAKFGTVSINGIGGDVVEGVCWRACQGLPEPRMFVLLVGTNNIVSGADMIEIGRRVARLAALFRARRPSADILILGIFARLDEMTKVNAANATMKGEVAKLDKQTHFADWGSVLTQEDRSDSVHPNAQGWRKILPNILAFYKSLK